MMIPRLNDNLINNTISKPVPSISSIKRSNSFKPTEITNKNTFKDLINLNNLKDKNYSIKDSTMKMDSMDLVIYAKLQPNNSLTNSSDYVQTSDKNYSKSNSNDLNSVEKENQSIVNNHFDNQHKQLGLIGLTNLGNTCYMNSGLQCLFNNKKLIVFFLNEYLKSSSKLNLANNSLTSCFVSLMKKVWNRSRDYNVIKPYEFKEIMSQNYSQFQGFRQHDCQEFLTLLLGTLHDQINQGLKLEQTKSINKVEVISGKEEQSPSSNCSNDLMDLSSRTTSPKSSLSVSTSSTYCDQLSEEEIDNNSIQNSTLVAGEYKKDEALNETLVNNNQTVVNPIQRLINFNTASIKTSSDDDLTITLQLSVKELTSKDTKLSNNNLHTDLNHELAYDSKKFNKTTIENELICSTAKQLSNQIVGHNEDYLDRYSDSTSTTSSTTSILQRNKKRNNPSSSTANHHLNNKLNENDLIDQNDLEKYNSPKRMKTDTDHDSSNEQQFENSTNEKFSSEIEWTKYLTKNKSIIVDTFQGQFKSTVKCSKCLNVSLTYEPFMYLPVTLPNALQRQIFVTFIPSSSNVLYSNDIKPARRYLISLNKHDKLDKLSNLLKGMLIKDQIATENIQLCFAEVDDKFIHKVLDSNTFLKYVDDKFRDLYAFEMVELTFTTTYPTITMPDSWETNQPTTVDLISSQLPADQNLLTPNSDYDFNSQNSFINNSTFIKNPVTLNKIEIDLVNNQIDENKLTGNFNTDYLTNANLGKKFIDYLSSNDDKLTQDNNDQLDDNLKDADTNNLKIDLNPSNHFNSDKSDNLQIFDTFDNCNLLPIPLSCAICLEEKDSSQLLIHTACSCQLCSPCLDMTVKHCSENETNFLCPTCSQYIDKSDFVPFGSKKPDQFIFTTNYYFIPILFRIQEKRNYNNFKLVTRPILLRLPSLLSGRELYEIIDRFVPCPCPYSLCFVSKSGQKCSRCDWNGNCNGCEITRIGDVIIQPKDSIAVEFVDDSYSPELESMIPDTMKQILDDPSVHDYKKPEKLTLHKCLKSFNQSEVLDDDNPWFCTVCNSNQKARKSLSIWKSPDTLIVYLKRFVFHDMNSIKVDEPVEFPIEKFDISPYYQVDNQFKENNPNEELIYDLKSIICHSGGVSSGHYTAFSKSCWNNKWYYFNDESVLEIEPSSSDERAYILFYEKVTPEVTLNFDSLKFKLNI